MRNRHCVPLPAWAALGSTSTDLGVCWTLLGRSWVVLGNVIGALNGCVRRLQTRLGDFFGVRTVEKELCGLGVQERAYNLRFSFKKAFQKDRNP